MKPNEIGPNSCKVICKVIEKYLDQRFYRCVMGKVKVAIKLTSMRFDKIVFTGSTGTGKLVA